MKIAYRHKDSYFPNKLGALLEARLTRHEFETWFWPDPAPREDLDVLLVMGEVERDLMERQRALALVQTTSAGYEGIDIDAATELGIWVGFSPSGETGNAISVAEFAIFLMIAAGRHMSEALLSLRDRSHKLEANNVALYGKSACIVGYGAIGRALAPRLQALGMSVRAVDRKTDAGTGGVSIFALDRFHEAIADIDFVIVAAPATKANENLIDARALAAMRRGAMLVNVARGTLVDETALAEAVERGHIASVGTDVLKREPADPGDPLLALGHVFVTPHIAGGTDIMLAGTVEYVAAAIDNFEAGRKPKALLNDPQTPRRSLR